MGALRHEVIVLTGHISKPFTVHLDGCGAVLKLRSPGTLMLDGRILLDTWGDDSTNNPVSFNWPIVQGPDGLPLNYNQDLNFAPFGGNSDCVGSITIFRYDPKLPDKDRPDSRR